MKPGSESARILAVSTGNIGDLFAAVPAINAMSRHFGARIALLASPSVAPILEGHPAVGEIITDDGRRNEAELVRLLQGRAFSHAVVFWSTARNARLVHRAQIPVRVGPSGRLYSRFRYTKSLPMRADSGDTTTHAAENLMDNARALGATAEPEDYHIAIPLSTNDRAQADEVLARLGVRGAFVALQPVRGLRPKVRWPVESFARLGDALGAAFDAPVVLVGSSDEAPVIAEVAAAMRRTNAVAAGLTDVRSLAALFAKATAVVALDSGPAHIAAGVGAPTVTIFALRTDLPERWRPLGPRVAIVGSTYECPRGCRKETCRDFACYRAMDPEFVARAAIDIAG